MLEEGTKYSLFLSVGSFCKYRGTDNVQQETIQPNNKTPGELYFLVSLFLLWQRYLQKDPFCLCVPFDLQIISDETLSKF